MSFIDDHHTELGIEPICRELAIAPSSWHEHAARLADPEKRPARAQRDDEIRAQIGRVHEASFGLYSTRKVWHQLRREGIKVAKCTVERLMRGMGLAGIRRGKTCVTTVSNPKAPCPLDKVNREFQVSRPNALWVVDFTYVHTWTGFVYVAFVSNLLDSRISFVACDAPHADRTFLQMLSVFAEHEARMISQRTKARNVSTKMRQPGREFKLASRARGLVD